MKPHAMKFRALNALALALAALAFPAACRTTPPASTPAPEAVLAEWMTGAFSSAAQAAADPEFFEVRLVMVPIWTERADGPWLYIEQAVASALDRPYRQRVYHLVREEGGVRSEVRELSGDALDFAGAWRDATRFDAITPADLVERPGCSVHLARTAPDVWTGSTLDDHCKSDFRGASYATSIITLTPDSIESWDRGWDAAGEQVWGAVKSGYVFDRVEMPE